MKLLYAAHCGAIRSNKKEESTMSHIHLEGEPPRRLLRVMILLGLAVAAVLGTVILGHDIALGRSSDFWGLVILAYFVPMIVAHQRRHRQRFAITILNIFAGWTVIGWVGGLVWACTTDIE
jgi:hypothetical protein